MFGNRIINEDMYQKGKARHLLFTKIKGAVIVLSLFLLTLMFIPTQSTNVANAATENELRQQYSVIQSEIDAANSNLQAKLKEKKTLKTEIEIFDAQIYAIQLQIDATQADINLTTTEIENLNIQIRQIEEDMKQEKELLHDYLRIIYEDSRVSIIEQIASANSFSEFINRSEYLQTMQLKVKKSLEKIRKLKDEAEAKKLDLENKILNLAELKKQQITQREGINSQKVAKQELLDKTMGQESLYREQLADNKKQQAKVWAEMMALIASSSGQNASSYSGGNGNGYLSWPSSCETITQGYGMTEFAASGAYSGKIHNGIDISCGWSPVKAAAEGIVLDMGTESNSGGWGNWIVIRHPNGLVTLYGHLSSFAVTNGQSLARGQIIGYEGNTGFSTGSHLHFSVYTNFVLFNTPSYHGPDYEVTENPFLFF